MRAAEQAQMLGDCGTRDGKSLSDASGGLAATAQEVEYGAAGGVGERLESGFGNLGRRICNRTVPHNA
jgi:hypothetical protein